MDQLVKAQIDLADINDLPRFDLVMRRSPPTRPRAPCSPPPPSASSAASSTSTWPPSAAAARASLPLGHASAAVRAGDLLFLSRLFAADGHRLIPGAHVDPDFPYAGSSRRPDRVHPGRAVALCRAAGGNLDAVTRQQLFYTDLRESGVSFRTMAARFGDGMPATSVCASRRPPSPAAA